MTARAVPSIPEVPHTNTEGLKQGAGTGGKCQKKDVESADRYVRSVQFTTTGLQVCPAARNDLRRNARGLR